MKDQQLGAQLIAAERQQQIETNGWTPERDDTHSRGELAEEAVYWASEGTALYTLAEGMCGTHEHRASKPRIKQLIIAGALIAAEIERLQRAELPNEPWFHKSTSDPIRTLLAAHDGLIAGGNHYAYFDLAYTRGTGWMAWLCTNARELDPNRKIIANGQGSTPYEACEKAVAALPECPPDDYPFAQPGEQ